MIIKYSIYIYTTSCATCTSHLHKAYTGAHTWEWPMCAHLYRPCTKGPMQGAFFHILHTLSPPKSPMYKIIFQSTSTTNSDIVIQD